METDSIGQSLIETTRLPWNKGRLTGAKPPLQPKHVWAIRTRLQLAQRVRDLALFNVAIDSKLRGCDVVRLRTEDVAPHGFAVDRATVRQLKTGRPVRFEITELTKKAVDDHCGVSRRRIYFLVGEQAPTSAPASTPGCSTSGCRSLTSTR